MIPTYGRSTFPNIIKTILLQTMPTCIIPALLQVTYTHVPVCEFSCLCLHPSGTKPVSTLTCGYDCHPYLCVTLDKFVFFLSIIHTCLADSFTWTNGNVVYESLLHRLPGGQDCHKPNMFNSFASSSDTSNWINNIITICRGTFIF